MYIEISDSKERRSFYDVDKVVFHSPDGDTTYTGTACIRHDKPYTAFTLFDNLSESSFNDSYHIVRVQR